MTPALDWKALGDRAIACKGWQESEGMRLFWATDCRYGRVVHANARGIQLMEWEGAVFGRRTWGRDDVRASKMIPDLRDHATVGCLLNLVRAAWSDPSIFVLRSEGRWECMGEPTSEETDGMIRWLVPGGGLVGGTEAEALVIALERAP